MGKFGAVSALDLSPDGTRLLCGHAKGLVRDIQICMFVVARKGEIKRRREGRRRKS